MLFALLTADQPTPTTQPPPEWAPYLPLLTLIAGLAAYVGAMRLWFHKVRMDAVDAMKKAEAEGAAEAITAETEATKLEAVAMKAAAKRAAADHMRGRYTGAVRWLRGLMFVDVTFMLLAVLVYKRVFKRWLFWTDAPADEWTWVFRIGFFAIGGLCIAHVLAGSAAWKQPWEYGGTDRGCLGFVAAISAILLLLFAGLFG